MIVDVEQRSAEWLQMRCGCITASRMGELIEKLKSGEPSAKHNNYISELVYERLSGHTAGHYVSSDMEYGVQWEEAAITAYQRHYEVDVEPGSLAFHPEIKWFAASADLRQGKGGAEIKCLKGKNFLDVIHEGVIPDKYLPQMVAQIACYEWEWCDFVAYRDDFPKDYRLFVRRLWRDETVNETIAAIEQEVGNGLAEINLILDTLKTKQPSMCYQPLVLEAQ